MAWGPESKCQGSLSVAMCSRDGIPLALDAEGRVPEILPPRVTAAATERDQRIQGFHERGLLPVSCLYLLWLGSKALLQA